MLFYLQPLQPYLVIAEWDALKQFNDFKTEIISSSQNSILCNVEIGKHGIEIPQSLHFGNLPPTIYLSNSIIETFT